MRRLVIAVAATLALYVQPARSQTYVCWEGGQKVFRDRACAFEEDTLAVYQGPKVRVIRSPEAYSKHQRPRGALARSFQPPDDGTDPRCRFQYFAFGDEKGKALAADAKEECLTNLEFTATGRGAEAKQSAYRLWLEHYKLVS